VTIGSTISRKYIADVGYRGHDDWRDMSDYLVHFTKSSEGVTAFGAMTKILAGGYIEARNAFGCATNVNGLGESQHCACFSEIPLDMLDRLVSRRSQYGIGFHQSTVVPKGGARVWYLDPDTPSRSAFRSMVTSAMNGGVNAGDTVWRLTPLVDYVAPNYQCEWEREWRVPGGLLFEPADVAFLFIPAELHAEAKAFLESGGGGAGPAYHCPILDPLSSDEQIQQALGSLPPQLA
jgi:hypothetical protein